MTDRKAMSRAYKEASRRMGVFRVRNSVTGRALVGSSVDLPAMLNRQRFQLEAGIHPNRLLQADWNELGTESFEFEELDTLKPLNEPGYDPKEDLRELEEMWLRKLEARDDATHH